MTRITFYETGRETIVDGAVKRFKLGAPFKACKVIAPGNGCKWCIMATRQGVSANVIERACSHNFKTRKEARAALDAYLRSIGE